MDALRPPLLPLFAYLCGRAVLGVGWRGRVLMAISSGGTTPMLATHVREKIERGADALEMLGWHALAPPKQTLAIYLSLAALDAIAQKLIEHARASQTPFVIVENGGSKD